MDKMGGLFQVYNSWLCAPPLCKNPRRLTYLSLCVIVFTVAAE
jgi:hypothetical protein